MVLRFNTKKRYDVKGAPPRRSVGTTHGSVSGLIAFRSGDPVAYESTLERDFVIRLETDPRVIRVVSQPFTVEYTNLEGSRCVYTPDYLVDYDSKPRWTRYVPSAVFEVKPRGKLERHLSDWRPRFSAAMRYCREQGYVFHLVHEGRIRDQRWQNAMFLRRYRKMRFEREVSDWILNELSVTGSATFAQLLARHFPSDLTRAEGIAHLWHLVATGRLDCDLDLPLTNESELWVNGDA